MWISGTMNLKQFQFSWIRLESHLREIFSPGCPFADLIFDG